VRLLFIGDIVGRPGRDLIKRGVRPLARAHQVDLVIANGENAAGGAGLTKDNADDIFKAGVQVITGGNHIWDKREILEFIDREPRLIRPANYPAGTPGRGAGLFPLADGTRIGVVNLMGRVFLSTLEDPFTVAEREIAALRGQGAQIIFVDFHAETTSEKIALSWFLDGRVTAVVGTHTHVQTADERILPQGTACLTDVGMTGPHDGVIGMDRDAVIARFRTGMPGRFEPAGGDPRLNAVLVTADAATGRATDIERISVSAAELQALSERHGAAAL
jgi:metallophosphoesterase (TIGR00282 family)